MSKPIAPHLLRPLLAAVLLASAVSAAAPPVERKPASPAHCACTCCTLTPSLHTVCQPTHSIPLPASHACDVVVPDAGRGTSPQACSAALCALHVPTCAAPAFLTHQCVSDRGAVRDVAPVFFAAVALVACAYVASRQLQARGSVLAGMPRPPVLGSSGRRRSFFPGDSSDEEAFDEENKPLPLDRHHEGTQTCGSGTTATATTPPSRSADSTPLLTYVPSPRLYDRGMISLASPARRHSFDGFAAPQPPRLQLSVTQQARRAASVGVGGAGVRLHAAPKAGAESAKPRRDVSPPGSELSTEQLPELHPTSVPSP